MKGKRRLGNRSHSTKKRGKIKESGKERRKEKGTEGGKKVRKMSVEKEK